MLLPLRLNLYPANLVPVKDFREFAYTKRKRPAYISDRDPARAPELPYWTHPPIPVPPPRPTADLRASPEELLARARERVRPDDRAIMLLLLAA